MRNRTSKAGGLIALGIVVLIVGLLSGIGLWFSADQRYEDAVDNLARAPVGCVTTLDFAEAGRYLLFVETKGELADVVGDCGDRGEFEWTDTAQPAATVTLTDPEGVSVGLDAAGGVSYDSARSTGRVNQSFQIDVPGDHLLSASDGPAGFAFAIGRDPNDGVALLRAGAGLAAAAGVVIGGALLLLAARRSSAAAGAGATPGDWTNMPPGRSMGPGTGTSPAWQPVTQPPIRPPVAPPSGPPTGLPTAPQTGPIVGQPPLGGGPEPSSGPPIRPAGEPARGRPDGSTGDGERSPWAPPAESGQ